jgi:hypothetical protein
VQVGEQTMIDQQTSALLGGEAAPVRSCWMCGIRLSADQLVADGGSACADLRWYCRDTSTCTERWTSRSARLAAPRKGTAEAATRRGEKAADADATRSVPV